MLILLSHVLFKWHVYKPQTPQVFRPGFLKRYGVVTASLILPQGKLSQTADCSLTWIKTRVKKKKKK